MKYIKLVLDNLNIKPNSEIKGHVTVNYPGAYDGIVINTLIMDSNKLIVYKSYNDEKISDNVSRLFISSCLLYTSPSPRDLSTSRMPSSA